MVKRVAEASFSEDEGDSPNLNGKEISANIEENKPAKKRIKTKNLFRQPTANELNRLQETENLFNSNLFRLQVEEILQEVKVKEKTEKKFQQWFSTFKDHLISIPENDTEYDLSEETLSKKLKIKLPISKKLVKTKCMFKFTKFKDVTVTGSYYLECAINSKLIVDLQIVVPAETYTKNDSINYRYHKKRAAYLAFIASHIKNHETVENLTYTWLSNSNTSPVLDIVPSGKLGKYLSVRIHLACESEAYKLHRFSPTRNNLREAWLFSKTVENDLEVGPPTPYYNSSVLKDLTVVENEEFVNKIISKCDNLKQAIILLKIWLRQRNLSVSGFIVNLLVSYLVHIKRINNIMSSYQIVRNVWIALKMSEWDVKGVSLHKGDDSPPLEEFHKHFPVVFLDHTGYYNICWQMSKGTYDALRREAALAVDMLDNGKINSFLPLFMVPVKPLLQFDYILIFKNLQKLKKSVLTKVPESDRLNYGLDEMALVTKVVHSLLARGLGDKVDLILQITDSDISCSVNDNVYKALKEGDKQKLWFGFVFNPENFLNSVVKGPPANLPEAEEFRSFWGEKSELRRFQDGAITEACVWAAHSLSLRRSVPAQIVRYLLRTKYDVQESEIFLVGDQLECLLSRKEFSAQVEESSLEVIRAFDELRSHVRSLTELPLDISAVYGTSPVFSYSSPLPAVPTPPTARPRRRSASVLLKDALQTIPPYTPANEAVIELSHSGKWPGDIEAFRCLKTAFHLQIAERLTKQFGSPAEAHSSHVDVVRSGFVFRLRIAHPKEITLLRKQVDNGVAKFRETEESLELQMETVLLPRLRGALHGLHSKHPCFGPAACLFRRWANSHLLSAPHLPPTVITLLAAAEFLQPEPALQPTCPTTALLRILHRLAHTDWTTDMIVLDFNGDMKREEIMELESKFSSREEKVAGLHIVTSCDGEFPAVWGAKHPSPLVLARLQALASSSLDYFTTSLLNDMKDNVLGAFVPSYKGYDVLIHLKPELVPHSGERVECPGTGRPLPTSPLEVVPVVEFSPPQKYLDELRSAFNDFALFFYDSCGGIVIAVLWKPDIRDSKEFQLLNANALKPVSKKGEIKYKVNVEAMVEDFRLLGEGLVAEVTVHS